MRDYRPCFFVAGILMAATGVLMVFPALLDLYDSHNGSERMIHNDWIAFFSTAVIAIFSGLGLATVNYTRFSRITTHQGFVLLVLCWMSLVGIGAAPFMAGALNLSLVDALFESVSGLTTTGATLIAGLDETPRGFLLWRAMLNWIGGVGIIIVGIALLPFLRVGGMQLFRLESSDRTEKIHASAAQIAKKIVLAYLILSALCALLYALGGMSVFDAIAHAMSTVSNGGFSTRDGSLGSFMNGHSNIVDLGAIFFMTVCAMPFTLVWIAMTGRFHVLWQDDQTRFFLLYIIGVVSLIAMTSTTGHSEGDFLAHWRAVLFNCISLMTGTGFTSDDYQQWGNFALVLLFCVALIGGCSGSAACGLKVFRLQIILSAFKLFAKKLAYPNGIFSLHYNGKNVSDQVIASVIGFFIVYFTSFAVISVLLSLLGVEFYTSLSATASTLANVGPGSGDIIGPTGNYAPLSDPVKLVLCVSMLLGRLEFYTLLVLCLPTFWKR